MGKLTIAASALEDGLSKAFVEESPDTDRQRTIIALSSAISLKRIADSMAKRGAKSHFEQIFGSRS